MAKITTSGFRGRRALVATLVLTLLVALGAGFAIAKNARVLGKTKDTPKPLCPGKRCLVTGTVSVFMRLADGERAPFKLQKDGAIVGWSIALGDPSASQIESFNSADLFGGPADARISVLKPMGKGKYKLLRQSSKIRLEEYFGTQPIFTLRQPLRVKAGHQVALTIPNWVPALTCPVSLASNGAPFCDGGPKFQRENVSVVSRSRKKCTNERDDILSAKPQQKVGSIRRYGCTIRGERILYRVYWAPSETKRD